jgi:hypothetical protein
LYNAKTPGFQVSRYRNCHHASNEQGDKMSWLFSQSVLGDARIGGEQSMKAQELNDLIREHLRPTFAVYQGRTHKIIGAYDNGLSDGYIIQGFGGQAFRVEKSLVEVY